MAHNNKFLADILLLIVFIISLPLLVVRLLLVTAFATVTYMFSDCRCPFCFYFKEYEDIFRMR